MNFRRASGRVVVGITLGALTLLGLIATDSAAAKDKVHLFILSGQSNMGGLKPELSFTPAVTKAFADDKVIVVKWARGGQPIARWYKDWKDAPEGVKHEGPIGDLYDKTMEAVDAAVGDLKPDTITFVWMQGERDAKTHHSKVYAASMAGLIEQLRTDLKRPDMNFVIGRLSDFRPAEDEHWTGVRDAQVSVAEADERGAWVDTDDLNGEKDALHYTKEGSVTLGQRFAEQAIGLVNRKSSP